MINFEKQLESIEKKFKEIENNLNNQSGLDTNKLILDNQAGSIISPVDTYFQSNDFHIHSKNLKIVDLTGAGDLFAAGFLHGYINKLLTKDCLEKGTEMSSKVIQQIGARL